MELSELRDGDTSMQEEAEFLAALVRAIKPTICLETGTHKGYASIHIGNALKANEKGHLWTYDITDYGQGKNITDAGLDGIVTTVVQDSKNLKLSDMIDFAFIDGCHNDLFVEDEFKNLLPQLNHGAIVIFHDHSTVPGSGPALAIKNLGIKVIYIPTKYGMGIYRYE